jgi:hypothetical protein
MSLQVPVAEQGAEAEVGGGDSKTQVKERKSKRLSFVCNATNRLKGVTSSMQPAAGSNQAKVK